LQKDGTVVGSIGNKAANIFMTNNSSNNTGFKINPDAITPSTSTGTDRDNAIDLGSSSARYKDIYLGGGAFLGGTGTANKLDDYEEGTWTPTDESGASLSLSVTGTAKYVKIGNTVFFTVDRIVYPSTSDTDSAALGGLPFTNTSNNIGIHTIITANANAHKGLLVSSSTKIFFYAEQTTTNSTNANLSGASLYGISGVYTI
jgi:hypothetical protein